MHALRSWIGMASVPTNEVAATATDATDAGSAVEPSHSDSGNNSQWPALASSRAAAASAADDDWTVLQAASCNSGCTRSSATALPILSFRDAALRGQTAAETAAAAAAAVSFRCTPPAAACRSQTGDSDISVISARSVSPFQCSDDDKEEECDSAGAAMPGSDSESAGAKSNSGESGDTTGVGACECATLRLTEEACRSCTAANDDHLVLECESDYWCSIFSRADVRLNSTRSPHMLSLGWTPTAGNGSALFRQRHKLLSHFFVSSRFSLERFERWRNDHLFQFLPGKSGSLWRLQAAARTCGLCGVTTSQYCRCDRSRRFDERPPVAHSASISAPFVFTNGRWRSKDDEDHPVANHDNSGPTLSRRVQLKQRRAAARHLRTQLDAYGAERIPRHKRPSSALSRQRQNQYRPARPDPDIASLAPSNSAARAQVRLTDACSFDDLRLRAFVRYEPALSDAGRSSQGAMEPSELRLAPLQEQAQQRFMQSLSAQRTSEHHLRLCYMFTPRVHMDRFAREGFAAEAPRRRGRCAQRDDAEDEEDDEGGGGGTSASPCQYPVWDRALRAYQFPLHPVKGEAAYDRTLLVCVAIAPRTAPGVRDNPVRVEAQKIVPLFLLDFIVPGAHRDDSVRRMRCGIRSLPAREEAPSIDRGLVRRVLRREHDRARARQRLLAAAPIVSILAPLPARVEEFWETCMGRSGGWAAARAAGAICDECEIGCMCCRGVCQSLSAEQVELIKTLEQRHRQWCAELRTETAFEERNLIVRSQPVAKAYDKRRRLSDAGFSMWSDFN